MKIRKEVDSADAAILKAKQRQLETKNLDERQQRAQVAGPSAANDTVRIALGAHLREELNPELLGTERAQRIQELKSLVASGNYRVDSTELAKSFLVNGTEEVDDLKAILGDS